MTKDLAIVITLACTILKGTLLLPFLIPRRCRRSCRREERAHRQRVKNNPGSGFGELAPECRIEMMSKRSHNTHSHRISRSESGNRISANTHTRTARNSGRTRRHRAFFFGGGGGGEREDGVDSRHRNCVLAAFWPIGGTEERLTDCTNAGIR